MSEHLRLAIELWRAGRASHARQLVLVLLRGHPHDLPAWFWYVEMLSDVEDRISALRNCLILNPESVLARQGLEHFIEQWRRDTETRRQREQIREPLFAFFERPWWFNRDFVGSQGSPACEDCGSVLNPCRHCRLEYCPECFTQCLECGFQRKVGPSRAFWAGLNGRPWGSG
jgi:hypothetical protein